MSEPTEIESIDTASDTQEVDGDPWESVPLPGTVDVVDAGASESPMAEGVSASAPGITSERENELLTLIHDLNDCNDVLLARASQLEASLQKAQQIIENTAHQNKLAQTQMAEHVSAQQAAAQLVSQNAQQQVAQLVAQLENAEESLQRQQLISENLQAELNNSQERITQLEHDGALSAQQYATEAQARVQAETSNKDLRSRLQRQQRYTLQFKAALEKSLTVTARSTRQSTHGISDTVPAQASAHFAGSKAAQPTSFDGSNVNMPKARRIMPWAAAGSVSAFDGIDPHLESLIRGAAQPTVEPIHYSEPPIVQPPVPLAAEKTSLEERLVKQDVAENPQAEEITVEAIGDSAAEAQLWQDLERVMDDPDAIETEPTLNWQAQTASETAQTTAQTIAQTITLEPQTLDTSDSQPVEPAVEPTAEPTVEQPVEKPTEVTPTPATEPAVAQHSQIPPFAAPAANTIPISSHLDRLLTDSEVDFTEPSPWGEQPLPSLIEASVDAGSMATDKVLHKVQQQQASRTQEAVASAVDDDGSEISPVVNQLRAQKKVRKPSAIQLPTFETAKAGSFKR